MSPNINIQILQTDLYIFPYRMSLVIILLILITYSLDIVWISLGENWCWSLLGLKGLRLVISSCKIVLSQGLCVLIVVYDLVSRWPAVALVYILGRWKCTTMSRTTVSWNFFESLLLFSQTAQPPAEWKPQEMVMWFLVNSGGVCGWAVNTSNSGSGGLGFKPCPRIVSSDKLTLLDFVSLHPGPRCSKAG